MTTPFGFLRVAAAALVAASVAQGQDAPPTPLPPADPSQTSADYRYPPPTPRVNLPPAVEYPPDYGISGLAGRFAMSRERLEVAREAYDRARSNYARVLAEARRDLTNSPLTREALVELSGARAEYEQAQSRLREELQDSARYRELARQLEQIEQQQRLARVDNRYDDLIGLEVLRLRQSDELRDIEQEAMSDSDRISELSDRLEQAQQEARAVQSEQARAMERNPELADARQQLEQARSNYESARIDYAGARAAFYVESELERRQRYFARRYSPHAFPNVVWDASR